MTKGEPKPLTLHLEDDTATAEAGADIALALPAGTVIHLEGDLGAGKTALARAMIRTLLKDAGAEVPSPTFPLVQQYKVPGQGRVDEIIHADLYRITDAAEITELGLDRISADQIMLIEWPERAISELPPADLLIRLEPVENDDGSEGRSLTLTGDTAMIATIRRSLDIRQFLDLGWRKHVERAFLLGDASARSYETASHGMDTRILMNAPHQPDGPPVRDGKPYSQIAHLAEDVRAFTGVAGLLEDADMRVPKIHAADLEKGLLLLEDLGSGQIITKDREPIAGRYIAAAQMLADLHARPARRAADPGDGQQYQLRNYDRDAMIIEAELLSDWYAPAFKGGALSADELAGFRQIWNGLIDQLKDSEKHLVLRDFHSPNILWQEGAEGSARIGLIDFQDAVIGPTAYDVASLAQDARVDIPAELEAEILNAYIAERLKADGFDETRFRRDYAIMAAQRATKILGIFVRLDRRDGKSAYLKHLPRLQAYIRRSFKHPALRDYRNWFEAVMGQKQETVTQA